CSTQIGVSPTVTVQGAGALSLTVNGSGSAISLAPGSVANLGVQNGPGTADCVTLTSTADSTHQGFAWIPSTSASLPFSLPTTLGTYVFRYWQNCSTQIAVSPTVTTTPSITSASVPPANQLPELPRAYVDTTMPTTTATVTTCGSGCNLQAA